MPRSSAAGVAGAHKTKPGRKSPRPSATAGSVSTPALPSSAPQQWLTVRNARLNNLRNVDAHVPLGRLTVVTGVSGSGKSSLVNDILCNALQNTLNGAELEVGEHDGIDGLADADGQPTLDKCIAIDQSPIGRTPRSNPATYTKLFDLVRDLYCDVPESQVRGYKPGRFSFNVSPENGGGRCPNCDGNGSLQLDMDFLADVWVPCAVCEGRRFTTQTLEVKFKDRSIADVLDLEVVDALELFANQPKIHRMLLTLHDVGLDYLKLGQPAPTLSGGEAQRVKLAKELCRPDTGRTFYVLDEPTTGLHFDDVRKLLEVLQRLVDHGNTVVVIEHHLDVIKCADWLIDLGPEGGSGGGRIVAAGTPEDVAACERSHTGRALRPVLAGLTGPLDQPADPLNGRAPVEANGRFAPTFTTHIEVRGAAQNNLKHIDVRIPRGQMTVTCGLSGSGKSTLAFDTVYAEGQRRYVESLSSYARQFLGQLAKPKVDSIAGLSPAIAIEQKNTTRSPRSTVGTATEIHDYLRVLWARLGRQHCPDHADTAAAQHTISDAVAAAAKQLKSAEVVLVAAPLTPVGTETVPDVLARLRDSAIPRVAVLSSERARSVSEGLPAAVELVATADFIARPLSEVRPLVAGEQVFAVVDRLAGAPSKQRMAEAIESAWRLAGNWAALIAQRGRMHDVTYYSGLIHCPVCRETFDPVTPHHFSFNAAVGWCPGCQGLGVQRGADDSVLIKHPGRPLLGAVPGWLADPAAKKIIEALHHHLDVPVDLPWNQWPKDARRAITHGTGDTWIRVDDALSVQWKGIFPAVDQLTRASWWHRMQLASSLTEVPCQVCSGARVSRTAGAVKVRGADGTWQTLQTVCQLSLAEALAWFEQLKLDRDGERVAGEVLREIRSRLHFLVEVGLGYLTLNRGTATLSGGEGQRVQLASQLGSRLSGVLYVLDEPTVGLHPADNARLIGALQRLRDAGNTLLVVEHDRDVIAQADHLLELGPGAGREGGYKVADGLVQDVSTGDSLTGRYLSGRSAVELPTRRAVPPRDGRQDPEPGELTRTFDAESVDPELDDPNSTATSEVGDADLASSRLRRLRPAPRAPAAGKNRPNWLSVFGATQNNLKDVDLHIPLGRLVCVTGVSGSGKSSLIEDVVWPIVAGEVNKAQVTPGAFRSSQGVGGVARAVLVDQAPIGMTPASTPATYVEVYDGIRKLFAKTPEARQRGWQAGHFSFNREGGRCEVCEGQGQRKIEMHFLPDVWVPCEHCNGRRFTSAILEARYKGKSIADVLEMRVGEAVELFANVKSVVGPLQTLADVGLGYLQLGQPATTLSGGEAQRVKLARELGQSTAIRHATDGPGTLYLLDEPTTGLHFEDVRLLINVLQRLVDAGHTVLVIEHNLDVLKCADWLIELGPEAGAGGGRIIAEGTPEEVAEGRTPSAGYLRDVLARSPRAAAVTRTQPAERVTPSAGSQTAGMASEASMAELISRTKDRIAELSQSTPKRSVKAKRSRQEE